MNPQVVTHDAKKEEENMATTIPELNKIAIRIPPFWPEKPTLWFCQIESQFELNKIVQDTTKYWYLVSQLDMKFAQEVEDIITQPPQDNKYNTIKNELVKRISTSKHQNVQKLLEQQEIGDRTPTQHLRYLRSLAGNTVTDEFLKVVWLNCLPTDMQNILLAQEDSNLNKIAQIADKLKENTFKTKYKQ